MDIVENAIWYSYLPWISGRSHPNVSQIHLQRESEILVQILLLSLLARQLCCRFGLKYSRNICRFILYSFYIISVYLSHSLQLQILLHAADTRRIFACRCRLHFMFLWISLLHGHSSRVLCVCVVDCTLISLSLSLTLPPSLSSHSPSLAHLIAVTLRAAQLGLSFQLCLEKRLKNTLQLPPPFCIRRSQLYATVPCRWRQQGWPMGSFISKD